MRRRNWYTGQLVTEGQMDTAFTDVENATWKSSGDKGFDGVLDGHVVAEDSPASMNVIVSGGTSYTPDGKRCFNVGDTTIDCSVDVDSISTMVVGASKSKIISVFAVFDRALLTPEYDVTTSIVYTIEEESMSFEVIQGNEITLPTPPIPPALRSDAVLLADITLVYLQSSIVTADISVARRQDFAVVVRKNGDRMPFARYVAAMQGILDLYEDHIDGTEDKHSAGDVFFTVLPSVQWANNDDWLPTVPTSVKDAIETYVVGRLATTSATSGAHRIGVCTSTYQSATVPTLSAGTLYARLDDMRNGANIYLASMASWPDGTPAVNGASSVYDAINTNVITRLGARVSAVDQGCRRIGVYATDLGLASWQSLTTTTVYGAFVALNLAAGTYDGASFVGAKLSGALAAGTVRSQLDALDTAKAALAGATFTGAVVLDGGATVPNSDTLTIATGGTLDVNGSIVGDTDNIVNVSASILATGDVGGARLTTTVVEEAITGSSVSLAATTGSYIFDASGIPLGQFRVGLPTVSSGNPLLFIRGKLLPASAVVYFCDAADIGGVPANRYEYWDGGVSTDPVTLVLQWVGGRWHVMSKSGSGLTGGAGTYAS